MLAVILAAGKGTRMKSKTPKVLHNVAGKPMLAYSIDLAKALAADKIAVVVGNGAEEVENRFKGDGVVFCSQKEQLGTADAVLAARKEIEGYNGDVLILCGDMPCIQAETIAKFMKEANPAKPAFISVNSSAPAGYGRVIRTPDKGLLKIVEEKDANENEKKVKEINAGIYYCNAAELMKRLKSVSNKNAQGEYYLTDIIGNDASVWLAPNEKEFAGVNDRVQLAAAAFEIWKKRALNFMKEGVSIVNPDSVYISPDTKISNDVTIYTNVYIEGATEIASGCVIRHGARIVDSIIGENTTVKDSSLIEESRIGAGCSVGPMAHLRPGSVLKGKNNVGNFVELKKATLHEGVKAGHLTYLGDAEIGENTNIGCGTITCNYDGFKKHKTLIGKNVFVGSDTQFVAPVTIGDDVLIAAGTTVTKDVPADSLAISRTPQENKIGKAAEIRNKKK